MNEENQKMKSGQWAYVMVCAAFFIALSERFGNGGVLFGFLYGN